MIKCAMCGVTPICEAYVFAGKGGSLLGGVWFCKACHDELFSGLDECVDKGGEFE